MGMARERETDFATPDAEAQRGQGVDVGVAKITVQSIGIRETPLIRQLVAGVREEAEPVDVEHLDRGKVGSEVAAMNGARKTELMPAGQTAVESIFEKVVAENRGSRGTELPADYPPGPGG